MRFSLILIAILIAVASARAASVDPGVLTELQDSNEVPVIVMLEKGTGISDIPVEKEHEFDALNGFSGRISRGELRQLLGEPGIASIELDEPTRVTLSGSVPVINASLVWPIRLDGINITGSGETVCVIDTGVDYNHTSMGGGFGNKIIGGYDFVNNDSDAFDDYGHGTYVAGIIASNNTTYRGVSPDAKIIAIKALDSNGDGFESDAIAGIDWCVANATSFNISVISMSLGGSTLFNTHCDSNKTSYRNAINAAVAKNISVIVSSGNSGSTSGISAPACIQNATAVGSTTKADAISSFSNRNSITDLLAPGSSITSLVPTGGCALCSASGISTQSGTSASAPHVSGAFALLRQFKRLENGTLLNPGQIEAALKAAGKNISDSGTGLTFQRINVLRSIFLLDTTKPSVTIISPANQTYNVTNISLTFSASDNVSLDSCSFTNTTGLSSSLSGCSNITFIAAEGQNNVTLLVNDSAGNSNSTQIFFTIDTTPPFLNITSPTNSSYQADNITVNLTVSDTNIDRCWILNATGGSVFLNAPRSSCNATTILAVHGLNNVTAYANDTGGNVNSSQIFFTVNLSFILAVQQPANRTYTNPNISVNYTISGFDTCWLALNGARINVSGCANTTITAAEGTNNLTINVNNSNGDINSTQVFFTLDTVAPTTNFTSPTPNNETLNTNDVIINITLSETGMALLEWNATNYTMNGSLSRNISFFDLADGNYSFRVFANDSHGNGNFTPFRWVFINATRNFSSYITTLNSSLQNVTLLLLNTTGSGDASNVLLKTNYTLRFNISGIITEVANFSWLSANTSNLINVTRNITLANISAAFNASGGLLDNYVWVDINNFTENYTPKVSFIGAFRLNYYINGTRDSPDRRRINETCNSGRTNVPCHLISGITEIYLFSFSGAAAGNDTQAPSVTIVSPSGTQTDSNVSLLYSASDNVAVDKCWFSLNSGANVTPAGCSNTTFVPAGGSNTLMLYANDTSGNLNSSSVTFTYSPPAPSQSSGGGGGGGGGSTTTSPQSQATFRKTWETPRGNATVAAGSIPVKFVSIIANSTGSASLIISPEKTGPVEMEYAYQYFSMNATNIKSAEITFTVNRSWLEFYELNKSKAKLSRWDNGWVPLATKLLRENSTHLTYLSEVPKFSYFAISGERDPPAQLQEPICIQVITPAVKDGQCVEFPTPCDVPEGWTKVDECPAVKEPGQVELPESKPSSETAFLVVSIIAVILAIFAFHKAGRRKR